MTAFTNPRILYRRLLAEVADDANVSSCCLGLTWTYCESTRGIGFAQSPGIASRVLDFPGTLRGQSLSAVARWLLDWDPHKATMGLAAVNAALNHESNLLLQQATPVPFSENPNLDLFHYFLPQLHGKKVVVVGRYPGMYSLFDGLDVTVLERQPTGQDLPDPAAEFILPQADWVFITATSLINKTFPRLAALSKDAVTVLMGPSTPWSSVFADYGIDFLAGCYPVDLEKAKQIAIEGGGTRLFAQGVEYRLADIGQAAMAQLKMEIAEVAQQRAVLKAEMEAWYAEGRSSRFPKLLDLEQIGERLSLLDSRFKRQWDARANLG